MEDQNNLLGRIDFGNEAGDDVDPDELKTYYVEQNLFGEFQNSEKKLLLATGKKGVGKSALLNWLGGKIENENDDAIVIKCTGADLARGRFGLEQKLETPNDHIRDWMVRICTLINRRIAGSLKWAWKDDDIALIESAELDGFKSRNLVSCLADRFVKFLGKASPNKIVISDEVEALRRGKEKMVWFLLDDLDATFQNTREECLSLSTFFSACRYLARDVKGIVFRVTLRTDVWPIVRRSDESLDKMQQYVRDIQWEKKDFRALLYKRIKAQLDRFELGEIRLPSRMSDEEREEYYIKKTFVPKMSWGENESATYKIIYTLSYRRPRWAIQLCKLAQKRAIKLNDPLINKNHIDQVWGEYGQNRISDLVAEHKHQCRNIEELLNAFRGSERRTNRNQLFDWIKNRITNHATPVIEGKNCKSPVDVAQFLYRIGFIVARTDKIDGEFEHYHFDEMPDFLSSKTSDDFGVLWEIHPCYREALDIVKLNYSQRLKRKTS